MPDVLTEFVNRLHREHLKPLGFKKQNRTFERNTGTYDERFNVQGSNWSTAVEKRFYINVGLRFVAYQDDKSSVGYFAGINHWGTRIEWLVPGAPKQWDVNADTDLDALLSEVKPLIDAARVQLAERQSDFVREYQERKKRVAERRPAEV